MRYLSVLLLLANCGLADTVMFRDGHTVSGSFLGGDSRTIRVAVGDHVDTIPVADINRIVFGDSGQALAPPVLRDRPDDRRFEQAPPPPPPPAARREDFDGPMIPSGTILTIRMV